MNQDVPRHPSPIAGMRIRRQAAEAMRAVANTLDTFQVKTTTPAQLRAAAELFDCEVESAEEAVRRLHRPVIVDGREVCNHCIERDENVPYPCPTIQVMDGER